MKTFEAKNREEWRNWLEENQSNMREIWLVYYKKHTRKPSITYIESVEEAICYGWIDGIKRKIDDERYVHRFSPRKKNSKWSPANINIAQRMKKAGMMSILGLKTFENRREYDENFLKMRSSNAEILAPDLEQLLKNNSKAWNYFNALAKSHRKQYIIWISSAKKDETKQKRLLKAIQLLEKNEILGMK